MLFNFWEIATIFASMSATRKIFGLNDAENGFETTQLNLVASYDQNIYLETFAAHWSIVFCLTNRVTYKIHIPQHISKFVKQLKGPYGLEHFWALFRLLLTNLTDCVRKDASKRSLLPSTNSFTFLSQHSAVDNVPPSALGISPQMNYCQKLHSCHTLRLFQLWALLHYKRSDFKEIHG